MTREAQFTGAPTAAAPSTPLRLLILEDQPADAHLMVRQLERASFAPRWQRVETEPEFAAAVLEPGVELVLADYQLPHYDALRALDRVRAFGLETPFIIVSGSIDEDLAVAAMRQGASDFVIKDRLARLGPAAHHALEQRRLRVENVNAREALQRFGELSRRVLGTAHDLTQVAPHYARLAALAHELASTPSQRAAVTAAASPVGEYLDSKLGELLNEFGRLAASDFGSSSGAAGSVESAALLGAVHDTIEVLEQTKRSFKSRALGNLRARLEEVLRSTGQLNGGRTVPTATRTESEESSSSGAVKQPTP